MLSVQPGEYATILACEVPPHIRGIRQYLKKGAAVSIPRPEVHEQVPGGATGQILAETYLEHLEIVEELGSTNDRGLERAREADLPVPALILARRQTAGRGRGGNVWQSAPGALTFSLIVPPPEPLPRERWPVASLAAGLAVRSALAQSAAQGRFQVKWPNDVFLQGKKIAGILTEATNSAKTPRLVIGIGINLNNSLKDAPAEIQERGISLIDLLQTPSDATRMLIDLLVALESELSLLGQEGGLCRDRWQSHCLLSGRGITIRTGTAIQSAYCRGVAEDGAIELETPQGVSRIFAGEVLEWR